MSVVRGIVREGGGGTSTSTYVSHQPQPQPQPQTQVIVQREIIQQPVVQQPIAIPQPPMGFHQFVYESPALHYVVPLAPQAEVRHEGAKPSMQPTRQPTIPFIIPQARKIGNGPIGQLIQKLLANFFRL